MCCQKKVPTWYQKLRLALVLHSAVPAAVQGVGDVRGQLVRELVQDDDDDDDDDDGDDDDDDDDDDDVHLVRELVHVLPREDPPRVRVSKVGREDVEVLVEDALELLVGDRAAGLHLHPLDPQSAGQLQTDPAKRGCLEDGRLKNNFLSHEGRDQGQLPPSDIFLTPQVVLTV